MKRILLIGGNGQIGRELAPLLLPTAECLVLERSQLNLQNPDQLSTSIRSWRPDIVINSAAYTAVDKAETDETAATAINALAPGIMAEECKRLGALLVHYSTDYVFDGKKPSPYAESDLPNPINAYGRSKLAGEIAIHASGVRHLTLRTSWVYGLYGNNFLLSMLKIARDRAVINVVADQNGVPNWSHALAAATTQLIAIDAEGLYHLTSRGETSWFGFAESIFAHKRQSQKQAVVVKPITTSEYPLPAKRPANSRLSGTALKAATGIELPYWDEALSQCLSGFDGTA